MNIKGFLFDLGNVLVDFNHYIAAGKIADLSRYDKDYIFNLFFDSPITEAFEEGRISAQDFFQEVKTTLSLTIGYEEFIKIWNGIFYITDKNKACLNFIKFINQKYPVVMISNINILHYEYINREFDIFGYFDKLILSFEVKSRKPKRGIYFKAEEFLHASAQEIIYADDRSDLVKAAKDIGYNAYIFQDIDNFMKEDLVKKYL